VEEGAIVPVSTPIAVIGEADEPIDLKSLLGEAAPAEAAPAAEAAWPEAEGSPASFTPAAEEGQSR
jgi:pyruvate/2-oxoglutarate dehydrogenase complex dihydrolipoamide acyltransferase (E2) component